MCGPKIPKTSAASSAANNPAPPPQSDSPTIQSQDAQSAAQQLDAKKTRDQLRVSRMFGAPSGSSNPSLNTGAAGSGLSLT